MSKHPPEPAKNTAAALPAGTDGDDSTVSSPSNGSLRQRVERIIDLIRPAVQSDGGDLELVSVSDQGVVHVRLHGACIGCPSSTLTLQSGIERNLKQHIPEITSVVALE